MILVEEEVINITVHVSSALQGCAVARSLQQLPQELAILSKAGKAKVVRNKVCQHDCLSGRRWEKQEEPPQARAPARGGVCLVGQRELHFFKLRVWMMSLILALRFSPGPTMPTASLSSSVNADKHQRADIARWQVAEELTAHSRCL